MPRKTTDCLSPVDIKNYLDNKLPAIEEYDIEQHLVDCPLCSAAIAGYSEHQNYEDLLTEISKLRPTDAIATNKIVALASENRPWIWWSAAALFICIPFSYYFYYQQTHTYSRFAAAYSELMPAPHALVRGENLATKTATDKAFLRYEQGDYETSLTAFE
ncbi:MAG: hypothetical protein RI894_353, partial [Bacteroidota bacterium]